MKVIYNDQKLNIKKEKANSKIKKKNRGNKK